MLHRHKRTLLLTGAILGAAICALLVGISRPRAAHAQASGPQEILRAFAVGGVLTADGTLWQYLPEKKRWYTIDEAFRAQGKETRILPLPVKAEEIADLSTWGFLVTSANVCWLYDIEQKRWVELPAPVSPR
jgi:hypothetical protein